MVRERLFSFWFESEHIRRKKHTHSHTRKYQLFVVFISFVWTLLSEISFKKTNKCSGTHFIFTLMLPAEWGGYEIWCMYVHILFFHVSTRLYIIILYIEKTYYQKRMMWRKRKTGCNIMYAKEKIADEYFSLYAWWVKLWYFFSLCVRVWKATYLYARKYH